ncbi:MAG: hypothetical protein SA339_10955 [Methanomassiliicoccus sp.]|nr:hypothetical protein [Methanomassiliicoccus sp.]
MSISAGSAEWIRPKAWKLDWELRRESEVVARMSSPSFFGTTVRATMGSENFVLRKGGLQRPGAAISAIGASADLARLEYDALDRGTVVLADGTTYLWTRVEPAGTWAMLRPDGAVLFTVFRDLRNKYPTGKVEVKTEDRNGGMLLLLVWFMINTTDC